MSKLIVSNYLSSKIIFTSDGWINATQTAKNFNKVAYEYLRSKSTQEYMKALAEHLNCDTENLRITKKGNTNEFEQGTFLHPKLAIDFARWISPKFAIWCDKQIANILNENQNPKDNIANTKKHLKRYEVNKKNIPNGYFSMIEEAIYHVILPLELDGKDLIDKCLPDGSLGKGFCSFLKSKGFDTTQLPTYKHHFEDGRVVNANLYPDEVLQFFKQYLRTWVDGNGKKYFQNRVKRLGN